MQQFTDRAWVLAYKAQSANCYMSGASSHEIKDEPQSGAGCEADAFMNVRAELLQNAFKKQLEHDKRMSK